MGDSLDSILDWMAKGGGIVALLGLGLFVLGRYWQKKNAKKSGQSPLDGPVKE